MKRPFPGRAWKLLGPLAALTLVASLAGNLLLARVVAESFVKLQLARIYPLGYMDEIQQPRTDPGGRPAIAFWGDSRAFLWDTEPLRPDWVTLNFAHGTQTSSQVLLQLETVPTDRTRFAVVQVGINDLHPLGVMGRRREAILDQLRRNIPAIRDRLLLRSDFVILTTIIPPGPVPLVRRHAWDPSTLAYIDEVNDLIRRAADGKRVLLLDAHEVLSGADARLGEGFADADFFLHVNRSAYVRLNAALRGILVQHAPQS